VDDLPRDVCRSRGLTVRGTHAEDYFHGLDAVRFVAALMVAIVHIGLACWAAPASAPAARILSGAYALPGMTLWIWFGWVGVQIFFVVSGFVIATSAEGASPLAFLKSRIVRLYPVAWLASTLVLIVLAVNGLPPSPQAYAASMLLLPTGPWIDGQYWTLGLEIMFYGLVFLLLAARRLAWIGHLATALGLSSAAYILLLTHYSGLDFLQSGVWRLTLLYFGIYFATGIFARLWMTGRLTAVMGASWILCLVAAILQTRFHALAMASALPNAGMNLADYWYVPTIAFFAGALAVLRGS
jgi:exopolysaccharide production protein ExoZ